MVMTISVGDRTSVQNHAVVQQVRLAFLRVLQCLQEVRETLDQILVDA